MRIEILTDPGMAMRGARILKAMIDAAPIEVRVRHSYVGDCDVLMVYGTGHPIRRPWWNKQLGRGGRCIGWDLGYWKHKDDGTCRMRVTIDADHPQRLLRPELATRWDGEGIALREEASRHGPVVVVGLSSKALRMHGLSRLQWEGAAIAKARAALPDREVVFRPKRDTDPRPGNVVSRVGGPIEDVIRGASLVICRHSNVAIDACIAGVPVVCQDGAAAALYGSDIKQPRAVTAAQRLEFLRSLAWWQWRPEEAPEAWTYLLSRLSA